MPKYISFLGVEIFLERTSFRGFDLIKHSKQDIEVYALGYTVIVCF